MPTAMPLQACDMQELCRLRSMFPEFVFPSSRLTDEEPEAQETDCQEEQTWDP